MVQERVAEVTIEGGKKSSKAVKYVENKFEY
jgi:hypothetical protein